MKKSLWVAGSYLTQFGELWERSLPQLCKEAIDGAIQDAKVKPQDIEAVFVSNMLGGVLDNQLHMGALVSSLFPHNPPAMRLEGACASGGLALLAAEQSLLAGTYSTVLVVGAEKMTDASVHQITQLLSGAADIVQEYGSTFPGLYALITQEHMKSYKTTRDQLSSVSVKNHNHALTNPLAQFQKKLTIEMINNSPMIADPLRMLDCSPISDGAAAVVLTTKPQSKKTKIIGAGIGMDTFTLAQRKSLTTFEATKRAAAAAYKHAQIQPKDIDAAEVHDCFSIGEIIAIEDLGFFPPGDGGKATLNKKTTYGGDVVINPSGGLKAMGHPVGATGVKQLAYLSAHGSSQGWKYSLAQNIGGTGATAVIHILEHAQ